MTQWELLPARFRPALNRSFTIWHLTRHGSTACGLPAMQVETPGRKPKHIHKLCGECSRANPDEMDELIDQFERATP